MISLYGFIFKEIETFWENLRTFFYTHKTIFDGFFLLLYTVQQLVLFTLILLFPKYASLVSGVFALFVITTISFEKICMESRYAWLKEEKATQEKQKQNIIYEFRSLLQENEILSDALEETKYKSQNKKSLNKTSIREEEVQ